MSEPTPTQPTTLDAPGDAELISAVRGGDLSAYGTLFERHVEAARRLARQLVSAGDVDDLVSEAFAKVLSVLQKGGGPDLAFRAYLLTSLRRLHVDKIRAQSRLTTTDDMTAFDPGVPFEDTAVSGFDNEAAARAFQQLPERWQQVLWHTEVEGQKPAEIAPLLGMTPNSVSALAYRAREGLKQAFISMHAQDAESDACETTRANLGAYIRHGLSRRDSTKVDVHLQDCRKCSAVYLELAEVNSNLGALLAPLMLGGAGTAYMAAGGATATKVGALAFFGHAKDWFLHNPAGRATAAGAGVAAAAILAASLALTGSPAKHTSPSADKPAAQPPAAGAPAAPGGGGGAGGGGGGGGGGTNPPSNNNAAPPAANAPANAPQAQQPPVITTPLTDVTTTPGGSQVIDLTNGATDPNGDPLSVKSASVASPAHGTVTKGGTVGSGGGGGKAGGVSGVLFRPLGADASGPTTVTYTADKGWRGTDTIDYVLTDGNGNDVSGTVKVTTPNTPPKAVADRLNVAYSDSSAPQTVDVLANDSDDNKDPLKLAKVKKPQHGTATIQNGKVVYTKDPSYTGSKDTFKYVVKDGHGGKAKGKVTIAFGSAPDLPDFDPSLSIESSHEDSATAPGTGSGAGLGLPTDTPSAPAPTGTPSAPAPSGTPSIPGGGNPPSLPGGGTGTAYEHVLVKAADVPEGSDYTTTLHYKLTGYAGPATPGDNSTGMTACGTPRTDVAAITGSSDTIEGECTLPAGDSDALHFDFRTTGSWTLTASITAGGYTDTGNPANNHVSASGDGEGSETSDPSGSLSTSPTLPSGGVTGPTESPSGQPSTGTPSTGTPGTGGPTTGGATVPGLPSGSASTFDPTQLTSMTPQEIAQLSSQQISKITSGELGGLSTGQLSGFTPQQVQNLTSGQVAGLSTDQLKALGVPATGVNSSTRILTLKGLLQSVGIS